MIAVLIALIFSASSALANGAIDITLTTQVIKLVFTTPPQTMTAGSPSAIMTIQAQDASSDNPVNVAVDITIDLTSLSAQGKFSLNASPWSDITWVTIPSGSNSASFYYKDTAVGNPTITAAESPDYGWADTTQQQTIISGGVGGGGSFGPREYFTADFLGEITKEPISSSGRLLNSLVAPSPDGIHALEMEKDTTALSKDGKVIKLIKITEAETPRLPENTVVVGKVYDFEPSGITFSQPIRLTLGYNINELPENAISVALAYYTVESGWVELEAESGVVAEIGKLIASVDHFTTFAVLASVPPPPLTPPSPPPPAAFELSNLSITPSFSKVWELLTFVVKTGEQVTITVDVTNYGGQEGNYNAILKINGVTQDNQEITLGDGQRQKIVFTVTENETGSYTVEIGNLSGEFQSLLWFNWWLIIGLTAVFILLVWLAWYYWYHRYY